MQSLSPLLALTTDPVAIRPEALQVCLAIATRGEVFADALSAAQAAQAPMGNDRTYLVSDRIAIIPIQGVLMPHAGLLTQVSGATSYQGIQRDLADALADDDVGAIMLEIDSPGGAVTGCAATAAQIRDADAVKPVYAYVRGDGCSAAYWLASAARKVLADSTARLGCLGVVCTLLDDSSAQDKAGERRIQIVSGRSPNKRTEPIDDAVLARKQAQIDATERVFLGDVARYRGLDEEAVRTRYGAGDVRIGEDARKAGLADDVMTLKAALNLAMESITMSKETPPPIPGNAAAGVDSGLAAQIAALTGETDTAKQQAALAKLQGDFVAAQADLRDAYFALARARNVPPTAMLGWEHLPMAALKDAASNAQAQRAYQPGAAPGGSAPAAAPAAGITDWDRHYFTAAGITDEAQMATMKADALKGSVR